MVRVERASASVCARAQTILCACDCGCKWLILRAVPVGTIEVGAGANVLVHNSTSVCVLVSVIVVASVYL